MFAMEVREHLTKTIIPFWQRMRDDVHGGYYGCMDYNLNVDKKAVKGCILNSRILWFFTNAFTALGDEELLHEAEHAYAFMMEHCMDHEYGGVFWSVTYDGKPEEDMKHTYNQAFAIYALSSFYGATKNRDALDAAYGLYRVIEEKCRNEEGYLEAFDRRFAPVSNEKLSENGVLADRTMNTLLHVFEAYTELYRVTRDEGVAEKLRWIMHLWADKIYNPKLHRQEVFFDMDYNSILDLHSYGHDIETAWLMDRGCETLKDEALTEKILPITKALTEEIYRRAYVNHSLMNECEKGVDQTSRIWWVQAEAVVGFLNGWQKEPQHEEYRAAAEDIWKYIKENIADQRPDSEWFWEVDENGEPEDAKPMVEPWKCPYHNGRMCFEIMKRLGQAERKRNAARKLL